MRLIFYKTMTFGYLKRVEFTKALGELFHNRVYPYFTEDIFGPAVYHNYICISRV